MILFTWFHVRANVLPTPIRFLYRAILVIQGSNSGHNCSIGKSVKGRDLNVMSLTSESNFMRVKPHVAILAGIHGNEAVSVEIALQLSVYLTDHYKTHSTITEVSPAICNGSVNLS